LESIELTPDDLRDLETAASIQLKTEDEYENEAKIDVFNLSRARRCLVGETQLKAAASNWSHSSRFALAELR
jgi:hypothetical protein